MIGKKQMPLSHSEAFAEFASCANPSPSLFFQMPSSRQTITERLHRIHKYMELVEDIARARFWSYVIAESTDTSVIEQVLIYGRYLNVSKGKIETRFIPIEPIHGHPSSRNIFKALQRMFDENGLCLPISTNHLVGHTSDGASVMMDSRSGVAKLMAREYNPISLFSIVLHIDWS